MTGATGESVSDAAAKSRMKAARTSMKTAAESAGANSSKPTMKASTAETATGLGRRKRDNRHCKRYKGCRNQFAKHRTPFRRVAALDSEARNKAYQSSRSSELDNRLTLSHSVLLFGGNLCDAEGFWLRPRKNPNTQLQLKPCWASCAVAAVPSNLERTQSKIKRVGAWELNRWHSQRWK